jgi:hypothetical protein
MVLLQAASERYPLRIPRRLQKCHDQCAAKQPARSVVHGTRDRCYRLRDHVQQRAGYRPSDQRLSPRQCHRVCRSLFLIQKFVPPRDFEIFSIYLPTVFVACFEICNRLAITGAPQVCLKTKLNSTRCGEGLVRVTISAPTLPRSRHRRCNAGLATKPEPRRSYL